MTRTEATAWMEAISKAAEAIGFTGIHYPHEIQFAIEWLEKKHVFASEIRGAGAKLRTRMRKMARLYAGGTAEPSWRIRATVAAVMCALEDP